MTIFPCQEKYRLKRLFFWIFNVLFYIMPQKGERMKEEIQYFNSHDAAKILGVNVSTVKRWTDEGKLECIKSIGGHRKFTMVHFAEFLGKNNKKISKINVFPIEEDSDLEISHHILKGNFEYLIDYVLEQAFLSIATVCNT